MKKGFTLVELIMIIVILVLILGLALGLASCQGCQQFKARRLGGTVTYNLDKSKKFINCSWKDNQLWILTESRSESESPKTYQFKEYSIYGIFQGEVIIKEN